MKLALLERLNAARRERQAAIAITDVATGNARLVVEADGYAGDPLRDELERRFASGQSGLLSGGAVLFTVYLPPPRLIITGAVHISQSLAPMASLAGFDVTIVDPRTAFATEERFPATRIVAEWPQDALPKLGLDPFTAVATLSHDGNIDDPALIAALAAGCFYVGALGSRKSHAKRLERLRGAGVGETDLARIHAPIGLAIAAQSPAEIAVSILADLIATLRSRGITAKEAAA